MSHALLLAILILLQSARAFAQESASQADIGVQQYYLRAGSRTVANISGLTIGFRQIIPEVGVLNISLAPAATDGRFQNGETFIELKGLPWMRQYWTFRGGDFRLPGRLLDAPFNNLYYPEIAGRGISIEANHGGMTVGFFFGAETLPAGVRVPLRLVIPQKIAGFYFRQKLGERLQVGARILQLSNDLAALRTTSYLSSQGARISGARTTVVDSLYTVAGPLKLYAEAGLSSAARVERDDVQRSPVSMTIGPSIETERLTFRANYLYQNDSYLPMLGYYLGDRRGPYAEIKIRPFRRVEVYGSASDYTNNVERDPQQATIRSVAEVAGASFQLPFRFSVNGQYSVIRLEHRRSDADVTEATSSQQLQITAARSIQRHSIRVAGREFTQAGRFGMERQRMAEVEDVYQHKWFSVGGSARLQRLVGQQSKTSVFARGTGQLNLRGFSAYVNFESGNDLANRTLFATNIVSTTVIGGAVHLRGGWDLTAEAFRNNLIAELNPQNIFVFQQQGLYVPVVLSAFRQQSFFFRMSKRFNWGNQIPVVSKGNGGGSSQTLLKGSVEGFVFLRGGIQNRGVQGIPVTLDEGTTVLSDAGGRFIFETVGEGAHKVGLAMDQLPADFNPGSTSEVTVLVRPGRRIRADLDVEALGMLQGGVVGPHGVSVETIVVKLLPTERYTRPDSTGRFAFYNLSEGRYEIELVEGSLPPFGVLTTPGKVAAILEVGKESGRVTFVFDVKEPAKPVRKVVLAPPGER